MAGCDDEYYRKNGLIRAVIGWSTDFYGPNAVNSPFYKALEMPRFLPGILGMFIPQITEVKE